MNDDDFDSWGKILLCIVILGMFLYFGTGCATAPSMIITDADVDAKIAAIGSTVPTNPDADIFNETSGKYELTPEAHDRALRDGIIKRIQDEKIAAKEAYLVKHPPMTFWRKVKNFGIGFIVGYLAGIGSGIYISQ